MKPHARTHNMQRIEREKERKKQEQVLFYPVRRSHGLISSSTARRRLTMKRVQLVYMNRMAIYIDGATDVWLQMPVMNREREDPSHRLTTASVVEVGVEHDENRGDEGQDKVQRRSDSDGDGDGSDSWRPWSDWRQTSLLRNRHWQWRVSLLRTSRVHWEA